MMRAHLSLSTLVAGILITAGCSPEAPGTSTGTGGARPASTGGAPATASGGAVGSGGAVATGGATTGGVSGGSGGAPGSGGRANTGGAATGGAGTGTAGSGTAGSSGGRDGAGTGGRGGTTGATGGAVGTGGRSGGSTGTGTCTASKAANSNASGSGPHKVVVETNSDPGIREGTIFRPMDLGGAEKYPIFVWAQGACSLNGLSAAAAMGEIASHGYFVVADGTPNGTGSRPMNANDIVGMGKPLIAYIDWAIAENDKPCSAYYQSLDTAKIGSNGFSCGGLMAEGTAHDPRIKTWGLNSSGMFSANQAFYDSVHTSALFVVGGTSDNAYPNGLRDYNALAKLTFPVMFFSKNIGHGGDLFSSRGGHFTRIDLAWLNWQLKGDTGATGKGVLVGSGCTYCSDSTWEVKSMNIQ